MNARALALLFPAFSATLVAQTQWSPAVRLSPPDVIDTQPGFATVSQDFPSGREWMAFRRQRPGEAWSHIYVMGSDQDATVWGSPPRRVTVDSAQHSHPSLARHAGGAPNGSMMLAWERESDGQTCTYWSICEDTLWSVPGPIDRGCGTDHTPCVVPSGSGYIIVWTRHGQVVFSEYSSGAWSPGRVISPAQDTLCSNPRIACIPGYLTPARAVAMWESGKPSTPDRAISWSVLSDSLWSAPDTLAWAGDNRRPKFYRMSDGGFVSASWETRRGVHWGILSSVGQIFGGVLQWMERGVPVSSNPLADDRQAVMQISPMITSAPADLLMWTAAVWTTAANGNDSIALRVLTSPGPVYRSGRPGTIDQNPDISTGVFHSGSIRLWTAWESDSSGHWALFGSSVDVPLNLVGGDPAPPGRARLLQNYPNPFNPVTTIRFTIPPGAAHTSLKVFDLLGREVATVVDEELSPGGHSVGFDGSGLASGVYIYRLRWGAGTETRRMVVLR